MIRFLFTGLLRDSQRSFMPTLVVAIGVSLTVVFHAWLTGIIGDSIEFNARFTTGHVKVMTKAYADNINQVPNDLALLGTDGLIRSFYEEFPDVIWAPRIQFAGLIDVPGLTGETRAQGNALGFGIDLLSGSDAEIERMNIFTALKTGRLPQNKGEALLSQVFSDKLNLKPGDHFTLIGSTMYGEMAFHNFILAGTVEFGTSALDRGTIIADISDVREALNMEDGAGEILGFFSDGFFDEERADILMHHFNEVYYQPDDQFSPIMLSLKNQNNMGVLLSYSSMIMEVMIAVFLLAMSIVLWNAGLLGGLRRYGEFGMRLAIGEEKVHVYYSLVIESLLIGIVGSLAGVAIGLTIAWVLQTYGIDFGVMMKNATMMMPTVFKARITTATWYIGFFPGILSTLIGAMLSGIGIYKRNTAQLFKELEA